MAHQNHLISALKEVESAFLQNELAYLALTQKVEHVFRDKLAFLLHQRLQTGKPSYVVCREWQRADLAILENQLPVLIVEAKAGYSFDIMRGDNGYDIRTRVRDDIKKATKLGRVDILISKFAKVSSKVC